MPVQAFQRELQTDDRSIQSYNFGGLNTTASRLNVPYNDATVLLNVNTGIDGSLLKRAGTQVLYDGTAGVDKSATSLRSTLGYPYTVLRDGQALSVLSRGNNNIRTLRTFPGVFGGAGSARTSWVQLPDTYPRVLGLQSDRMPIEVYIVEQRQTVAAGGSFNTFVIPNCKRFSGEVGAVPAPHTDTVYVTTAGVTTEYVPGSGIVTSYNSVTEELVVTFPSSFTAGTYTIDVVGFRWCWWAESLRWFGDRFFDTFSRFNVTSTDNNVAIPAPLRSDLEFGVEPFAFSLYKSSLSTDTYTFANQPATSDEYNIGDGSVYTPGANNYLNQTPFFLTFGLARTPFPQPPETVRMARARELRFNGGVGIEGQYLRVTVGDTVRSPVYGGGGPFPARAYTLFTEANVFVTSATTLAYRLSFNVSLPIGVDATDIITMTNVGTSASLGASYLEVELEESGFQSGSYRRAYGLGLFADYRTGIYPSTGAVYQGRLALSGVATDKARVVLSSLDIELDRYSFFQITDDLDGIVTDPFDLVVSGGDSDDFVVGITEWNASLFILTRRSTYRVSGGDQPLSALRRFVTYLSNIGLVNQQSIVRTDTAVYYLSDSGVFNLTPRVEDSEFNAIEKSLKIRSSFVNRDTKRMVESSSMYFDAKFRRLYVTLPNLADTGRSASDVYVFDTTRDSWTLYNASGGFKVTSLFLSTDRITGASNTAFTTPDSIVMFDALRYVDFYRRFTGVTGTVVTTLNVGSAVLTVTGNQRYDIPDSFFATPFTSVKDLRLILGTSPLTAFTKYAEHVYLTDVATAGQYLWFINKSTRNASPQGLLRYGAGDLYPYTAWVNGDSQITTGEVLTLNTTTRLATLSITSPTLVPADVYEVGQHYLALYTSPMFTQQMLGTVKRTKHAYLYFNNEESSGFTSGDLVEKYNINCNANVTMLYDSDDSDVITSEDIYGYEDIVWDNAYFDVPEASQRINSYSLFKEPLIGVGYSYRLAVWSYDDARWNMVGYQIDANNKGKTYINAV